MAVLLDKDLHGIGESYCVIWCDNWKPLERIIKEFWYSFEFSLSNLDFVRCKVRWKEWFVVPLGSIDGRPSLVVGACEWSWKTVVAVRAEQFRVLFRTY